MIFNRKSSQKKRKIESDSEEDDNVSEEMNNIGILCDDGPQQPIKGNFKLIKYFLVYLSF